MITNDVIVRLFTIDIWYKRMHIGGVPKNCKKTRSQVGGDEAPSGKKTLSLADGWISRFAAAEFDAMKHCDIQVLTLRQLLMRLSLQCTSPSSYSEVNNKYVITHLGSITDETQCYCMTACLISKV
jgi:hypothetical protein